MAPDMEKRLLAASPLKPFVWKRFIFLCGRFQWRKFPFLLTLVTHSIPRSILLVKCHPNTLFFSNTDVFKGPGLSTLKPGSHLCNKHNTSEISISISTRKKEHVSFFLCLCLFHLCYAYCTNVNQALEFSIHKPISSPLKLFSIHTSYPVNHSL